MDFVNYVRNQWDRAGAWLCVIGGAIALLVGYLGVSDTLNTGEQLPYVVSGGLVGLFLLGLGALLWVSADLRDEWRKLDAIDRHLVEGGHLPDGLATLRDEDIRRGVGNGSAPARRPCDERAGGRRGGALALDRQAAPGAGRAAGRRRGRSRSPATPERRGRCGCRARWRG